MKTFVIKLQAPNGMPEVLLKAYAANLTAGVLSFTSEAGETIGQFNVDAIVGWWEAASVGSR